MLIKENGWEKFWPDLKTNIKKVFSDNETSIIENAQNNPENVLPVSEQDEDSIREQYDSAVDLTVEKTAKDINKALGGDLVEVPESQITLAKLVGVFFIVNTVKRAYERLHGARIARQTQSDQDEALKTAIELGNNQIDLVTQQELSMTYSQAAKQQFESRGQNTFKWVHSGSEHPRKTHLAHDGQIFNWDAPPDSDGFPGEAFNCACYADLDDTNQPENTDTKDKIMNKKTFNLKADEKTADLHINGVIGDYDIFNDSGVIFSQFKDQLNQAIHSEKTKIFINSEGGYVFDGIAIYNLIRDYSKSNNIEIHISGLAASIASIIPLAVSADKRFIHSGSIVMIHNPWMCVCGENEDLNKAANELDIVADSIARIYAERTNLYLNEAKDLMKKETYFSDKDAVESGFANLIQETPVKASKSKIKQFIKNLKSCTVEQKIKNKNSLKYEKLNVNLNHGDFDMELKEQLEALKSKVDTLQNSVTEQKGKLDADAARIAELETERDALKEEVAASNSQIENAKTEALKNVKNDLKAANEARVSAQKAGIKEVDGDTLEEVQRNVLIQAKVSNPEAFNTESLNAMFEYVLNIRKDKEEAEHDDAFDTPKNETVTFKRPVMQGAK